MTTGTAAIAAHKLLGKTVDAISEDLAKLYGKGRDKIAEVAVRKIKNLDDGAKANLRVARDVFWNGSYTDESICAEYFGGILAASRSQDGKDDTGVFYVDIIKSLSSGQLKMHYILYRSFNKMLMADESKKDLNPAEETKLQGLRLVVPLVGILKQLGNEDLGAILHGLRSKGLIGYFASSEHKLENGSGIPNLNVAPTSLGIQLFAIANNMFPEWYHFSTSDFGDFPDIKLPELYASSLESLLEQAGLNKSDPAPSVSSGAAVLG